MLYDEFDKLLVCRILKKEENVTSGETLDFGSYLVDIGDLEGGKKPETNLNVDRKHKSGSRFRTPSVNGMNEVSDRFIVSFKSTLEISSP